MNVKFYLSDGKRECTLRACIIADRNHQFKVQIPFKIEPQYWHKKDQCAKSSMKGSDVFNESLHQYKLDLLKQIRLMNLDGIKDWENIKNRLKSYIKTGEFKNVKAETIKSVIVKFIETKRNEYKPGTIRKYHILSTLIQLFETKYNIAMSSSNIDYSLTEKFRQYILYDRNNRNDTAYRMIAALKCVIRWMIKSGYDIDPGVLKVSQPVKNKYDIVTLSEEEIQQINTASLSPEQELIKDCFLFMIYTGQRF